MPGLSTRPYAAGSPPQAHGHWYHSSPFPATALHSWLAQTPHQPSAFASNTHICSCIQGSSHAPQPHGVIQPWVIPTAQLALPRVQGGAAGKPSLQLGADFTLQHAPAQGAHGAPWPPPQPDRSHRCSTLATIPWGQGPAMLSMALPGAGDLLCRHRHPCSPESLKIY